MEIKDYLKQTGFTDMQAHMTVESAATMAEDFLDCNKKEWLKSSSGFKTRNDLPKAEPTAEAIEKACIEAFSKVKSEHCLYDNYKQGFEDCINWTIDQMEQQPTHE